MQVHKLFDSGHLGGGALLHSFVECIRLKLCHKFVVVNASVLIGVNLGHQLVDVPRGQADAQLADGISELYGSDVAVSIFIKLIKDVVQ